jgi:hypothetical protein
MAMVDGAINIVYTFQDDDLATATERVHVPPGTTLVQAKAFATSYAALVQPLSDCAMRKYTISQEVYDDTYPLAALGSDVEDKGVLTFRTVGNGSSTMTWPGVLESLLVNTISRKGVYIDLANVAVSALVSALLTGLGAPAISPSTRRGDDLVAIKDAYKQNRASQASQGNKG